MRACVVSAAAVIAFAAASMSAPPVLAAVDLVLVPEAQIVPPGTTVDIGLYAVSNGAAQQWFSAMDVVLTWDPMVLQLLGAIHEGPHAWMISGFKFDRDLDGLNADCGASEFCTPYTETPYNDGNALYQALSISPARATPTGLLVVTLRFQALANVQLTSVMIEPQLGRYSRTRVFGTDEPNQDVTGTLGSAELKIAADAMLRAVDLLLPAGRTGEIVVSGEIAGQSTVGVTIVVELVPPAGAVGTVTFTPAPPVDVRQIGDPWPVAGLFSAYDTDTSGSLRLNGSVDDNGDGPGPVTFAGLLSGFPVTAAADAVGVWDIRLTVPDGTRSNWEGVATALVHGKLTVVKPGDGDGSGRTDMRDFSELQACFTGSVGPVDPPVYREDPALRCRVYDFDEDGDVDAADYAPFREQMSGPVR